MRLSKKAQSTLEYTVLIAVVVGALLAMQIYMKRGVQGKLRESSDQIGEQFDAGKTRVFSHREHSGVTTQEVTTAGATITKTGAMAGVKDKEGKTIEERQTESGSESVSAW